MMTKKQRSQVVELLRCAADLNVYEDKHYGDFLKSAAVWLCCDWEIIELARLACAYTDSDGTSRYVQLQAAARVEEKSWP
jgi:hypothetical protein